MRSYRTKHVMALVVLLSIVRLRFRRHSSATTIGRIYRRRFATRLRCRMEIDSRIVRLRLAFNDIAGMEQHGYS
jgi:hypothetical protein